MKVFLIFAFVCLLCVAAFAGAVVVAVVRLRAKQRREQDWGGDDPLSRMFAENRRVNEERQAEAAAALDEGDPFREWVARGAWVGYVGFDGSFVSFDEEPGERLGEVRGVKYDGDKEPNFKRLPVPDCAFGVDLGEAPVSDRGLGVLAEYPGLSALNLFNHSNVTDETLKVVRRMPDLVTLGLCATDVTARGARHLTALAALRYLSVSFAGEFADAVGHLRELTQLVALVGGSGITDDDLRELSPLVQLAHFELSWAITDAGLRHLAPFGRMTALKVTSSSVTDAGLHHIGVLGALQTLTLVNYEGGIRGPGLAGLTGLKQLRDLHLANNALTGEGFEHFAALTGLRRLFLWDNPITDAGLARLRLPPGLVGLSLGGPKSRVTDAGVARLELPESVTEFGVSGAITDASIPVLAKFTHLTSLGISETKLTLAGAHRLSDALPNCVIQTSFPK